MIRQIVFIMVLLCLPTSPAGAGDSTKFRTRLNEFITIALENNPQLLEAKKRIAASKEIPSQAGSLEDPMLQLGLMNLPVDSFAFDEQAMTQKQVTVSQKFPFPGKLKLREEIARKNVYVNEQDLEELKLDIRRQVKQSYFELCFVLAAIDITRENKFLLEQFVTITESKYSVGKGIQQDVLKAQVELSKLIDELIQLRQRKKTEEARLNTLMNHLPQAPLTIPHGITKTPFKFQIVELQSLATEHRPILQELNILKEKFVLSKRLAEKEYYPDFKIGLRYGQREDGLGIERPDFVSAFVGINIPLWHKSKQSRKVAEKGFQIERVEAAFHKVQNQVFLKIKELIDEEERTGETLKLIQRGILPQARQSLEAALAGYSVDKVDFLTLLDNQVTLFKWQLKYHKELATYEKNLAELEREVGKELF